MVTDQTTSRRAFLRNTAIVGVGAPVVMASLEGCLLQTSGLGGPGQSPTITGHDADVNALPDELDPRETDAGMPDAGDADVSDACDYQNNDLPTLVFNVMDWPENLEDQRIYEGGLKLGDLFEASLSGGTAYEAVDFRNRYDRSDVKTALYNDLNERISEVTCATGLGPVVGVLEEMFEQIFSKDNESEGNFSLNTNDGETAVYFSRIRGETYFVMLGAVSSSAGQPAEPKVLYYTPMDNTTTLLEEIEQEGI